MQWPLHIYLRLRDALACSWLSRSLFCGKGSPNKGCSAASAMTQLGLQVASSSHSPMGLANPGLANRPPGLAPHLPDVGPGRHRIVDAIDGEDDVRQGVDGIAADHVL